MHKLLVCDLDGTLADIGKSMANADVEKLIELEKKGYTIVICSGKPSYYLCGFARQLGLQEPILIGENGAVFHFGIELPPKRYEVYPYSDNAKAQLSIVQAFIDHECGDKIWYQPNEVGLTPFPKTEEMFDVIQCFIEEHATSLDELMVYRHSDSFDFTPQNINKSNGLAYLVSLLELEAKDVIAIGDGVNDIPMFAFADVALGIAKAMSEEERLESGRLEANSKVVGHVDYAFGAIGEALDFIKDNNL